MAIAGEGMGQGARTAGGDLPPAPQSHVLDDAELFREQPEKLTSIKASLAAMEEKHAYPVYLAVYYSVYDGNLQARADALRKAWIGEKARGMVIVYQLDPVVSGNNPSIAYYRGSELQSDLSGSEKLQLISGPEVDAMLERVFPEIKSDGTDGVAFLDELIAGLEGEIGRYHEVKPTRWTDRGNLKLMAVFLGTIVVLSVLGMLGWRWFVRAEAKSGKVYYFPEVKVGRRLEAPFGGGWVSERTFVPFSSRH